MVKHLEALNKKLGEIEVTDYYLHKYEDESLTLLGSFDISLYHDVEIAFDGVQYICCPSVIENPRFRLASPEEIKRVTAQTDNRIVIDEDSCMICIDENSRRGGQHFLIARAVEYKFMKVMHYVNEDILCE